jgi:formylmethanofuran dehydrogenase subunit E
MSSTKFQPGIKCEECGYYVEGNYTTDTDFRREYDGKDVCVSCYTKLKLENGDYEND